MLVTAILGPLITARSASNLIVSGTDTTANNLSNWWHKDEGETEEKKRNPFLVVVPIYNPQTQRYLLEMAAMLARHEAGQIVPLAIAKAGSHMDDPQLTDILDRTDERLQKAVKICKEFNVEASPSLRIDDNVALGIGRASREKNASLVVMGWGYTAGFRSRLFGNLIDLVFLSSHCPVAVTRLFTSPAEIRNILVPIDNLTRRAIATVRFAQILADTNQAQIVLLHVCDRRMPSNQMQYFESQLSEIVSDGNLQVSPKIQTIANDDVARTIIEQAKNFDLVVLRSVRYRTAGGLAVSEVTTRVIKELKCSIVLLGEPRS